MGNNIDIGIWKSSKRKKKKKPTFESYKPNACRDGNKAPKAKKAPNNLYLGDIMNQVNYLSSKTKLTDVEAMYITLEEGLGDSFPYVLDSIKDKINVD